MPVFSRLQMYWEMLSSDPLGFLIYVAYLAVVVLISLILHECAHGHTALMCGDPTAKMLGRLSLRPSRHLDPIGTLCMLLLGFGWAKPVPVNPRNFKGNYRSDDFLVSIAGITVNFTLFLLCSAVSVGLNRLIFGDELLSYYQTAYGTIAGFVNPYASTDVPIALYISYVPRLSDVLIYSEIARPGLLYVQKFLLMMAQVNLSLAVFNFLPLPPLDGYHIFNDVILRGRLRLNANTFRWTQIALYALLLTGVLTSLLTTVNTTVYSAVVKLWLTIAGAA